MSFIHFGCWNKNFCDINKKDSNGLSQVMNALLNKEKQYKPNLYIINGDNYYPDKSIDNNGKKKCDTDVGR